jgi:hypothetical protein
MTVTTLAMQFRRENVQKPRLTVNDLLEAVSKHKIRQRECTNEKQKLLLGRFSKKQVILPMFADDNGIDMKCFGLFDTQTFLPTVYIGVTGAGKTHQILRHAANGFVCYTTAADKEIDEYYKSLKKAIALIEHVTDLEARAVVTTNITLLWIISKLACLYVQLSNNEEFTPLQFATSQFSDASQYYADCFDSCLAINASTNWKKLKSIHAQLVEMIRFHTKYRIGIAFDEAQLMINEYECSFPVRRPSTETKQYRDLLYGLSTICAELQEDYDYIAFAGTKLSLIETMQSATGRGENADIFVDFPYFRQDRTKIVAQFKKLVEMDGCIISKEEARKLSGRPQTLHYAVQLLQDTLNKTKQGVLKKAIHDSYAHMRSTIFGKVLELLKSHTNKEEIIKFLFKIIIARAIDNKLGIKMSALPMIDLVDAGIFHLRFSADKREMFAIPNDHLGLDVIKDLLEQYKEYLPQDTVTYIILQEISTNTLDSKGGVLEKICKDYHERRIENNAINSVFSDLRDAKTVEINGELLAMYQALEQKNEGEELNEQSTKPIRLINIPSETTESVATLPTLLRARARNYLSGSEYELLYKYIDKREVKYLLQGLQDVVTGKQKLNRDLLDATVEYLQFLN